MENDERHDSNLDANQVEQPVKSQNIEQELQQLKATNDRLLAQSKENADKYRAIRDKQSAREKLDLEEKENWKERLDIEKNDKMTLQEQFNSLRKETLKKDLNYSVAKLIDAPLAQGASIDDVVDHVLKTGILEMNDQESGFNNIAEAYAQVKDSKGFIFNNSKAPMANAVPGNNAPKEKQLTAAELLERSIKIITKK